MKIIGPNSAFAGRRHIPVSGQFPPQAALEVLNVPNRQLAFPGLVLGEGQIKNGRASPFFRGRMANVYRRMSALVM